jgi:NitT/TauT family transport system permease protein
MHSCPEHRPAIKSEWSGHAMKLALTVLCRDLVSLLNKTSRLLDVVWFAIVAALAAYCVWQVVDYISTELSWPDVWEVFILSAITMVRVALLIALASVIWVPLGVWIGLRPRWAEKVQPLAQFLAAFPAICCFRSPSC